ncbi:type VI secretion system protein IglI family protein [Microbulbifer variabilis]|uniref:type VI secretion system protein IglI family protein n=1 Tax=Microbulbifer variabilis TaxID=266805 RepID=UPI001CFF3F1A|nr:type VI secretion system protein IglI family protein [Microbulbifer variabilis]
MSNQTLEYLKDNIQLETCASKIILDEYFQSISSSWVNGNFLDIISHCDEILLNDTYDVRIVFYYLYSLWVESDSETHVDILSVIQKLLEEFTNEETDYLESDPVLAKYTCESISVFFKKLAKRLERFTPSVENFPLHAASIYEQLINLQELIGEDDRFSSAIQALESIVSIYFPLLDNKNEDISSEKNDIKNDSESEENLANPVIDYAAPTGFANSECSYYLSELIDKIDVLKDLTKKGEDYKAAIVVEDIRITLANFDPLIYLPNLFKSYTAIIAEKAAVFSQYISEHDDNQWQALQQCYMVDRNGFRDMMVTPAAVKNSTMDSYSSEMREVFQ